MKKILASIFGLFSAIMQAVYWFKALLVAKQVIYYDGQYWWRSGGPGAFLPWPKEPGMLTVLTPMSSIDAFIYAFLIKLWLFIPSSLILTIALTLIGWFLGSKLQGE